MAKWVRVEYTETIRYDCYVRADNIDIVHDLIANDMVYEKEMLELDIALDKVKVMTDEEVEEVGL
ncbi:hypothetical protein OMNIODEOPRIMUS_209 [Bacillus phage OmnioDeoPrimus]|nr:hypothetical protein ZAINNY_212 [Bacillus phage Zainny]AXQ67419.1 hypothetical protein OMNIODEOPRIMUS_209 [Bacillus phage OmnioDeoPrimus]